MEQELLSHFWKDESGRWICKFAIRLASSHGPTLSFTSGQMVYAGDHHYKGKDLAAELNRIAAALAATADELETTSYMSNRSQSRTTRL